MAARRCRSGRASPSPYWPTETTSGSSSVSPPSSAVRTSVARMPSWPRSTSWPGCNCSRSGSSSQRARQADLAQGAEHGVAGDPDEDGGDVRDQAGADDRVKRVDCPQRGCRRAGDHVLAAEGDIPVEGDGCKSARGGRNCMLVPGPPGTLQKFCTPKRGISANLTHAPIRRSEIVRANTVTRSRLSRYANAGSADRACCGPPGSRSMV
jgi:hypothetical protein